MRGDIGRMVRDAYVMKGVREREVGESGYQATHSSHEPSLQRTTVRARPSLQRTAGLLTPSLRRQHNNQHPQQPTSKTNKLQKKVSSESSYILSVGLSGQPLPAMAPASLGTLPVELLSAIFSHLCWYCTTSSWPSAQDHGRSKRREKQTALLSLSKTCRLLNAVAERFRHHAVCLSGEFDLYFLLRTLLERPDLAARMSAVDLGHVSSRVPHESGPVFAALRRFRESLRPQSSYLQPTQHGDLVLFLLQVAPNLERAGLPSLGGGSFETSSWLTPFKALAFTSPGRDFELHQTVPILRRAPNVEILHFYHHGRAGTLSSFSLRGLILENITELALIETFISPLSFRNLLSVVGPRLCKVIVRRTANRTGSWILEFDEALAELGPWRATLKELIFTMETYQPSYDPSELRRLREFQALEIFWAETAYFDLSGSRGPPEDSLTSMLPPSLRELRLFGRGHLPAALRGLAGALTAGQFPHLRALGIDDQGFEEDESEGEPARELRDVGASFQSAGVAFVVHPTVFLACGARAAMKRDHATEVLASRRPPFFTSF